MADRDSLMRRLGSGLTGLLIGAVLGLVVLILAIMITNSTFGLTNIWPGAAAGACLGALIGVALPEQVFTAYRRLFGGK